MLTLVACLATAVTGAPFSGSYEATDSGEPMTLELHVRGTSARGTLIVDRISGPLVGKKRGKTITGRVSVMEEPARFVLEKRKAGLRLTLLSPDGTNQEVFQLRRTSKASQRTRANVGRSDEPSSRTGKVIVNGKPLGATQVAKLARSYGVQPRPGSYWYDAKSGMYGVVGYAAYGFMRPGHRMGRLQARASNGDTGVFVNGRELPRNEWMVWSGLVGAPIQRGRYWLDGRGNAGYEGKRRPLVNLYAAAAKNRYRGNGGGDNFWTSRFSAGNSDRGGSRGYVSVPGYGPVGYGF